MLRENDTFKVVLDPGTDKVEKQCLGPVPAFAWDTGGGKTLPTQPLKNGMAELIHFIGVVRGRQFCGRKFAVPVGESCRRGDTDVRRGDNAVEAGQIFER